MKSYHKQDFRIKVTCIFETSNERHFLDVQHPQQQVQTPRASVLHNCSVMMTGFFFPPMIYAQAQWREPPVMCCRYWDCYVSSLTPAHISPCSTTKSDMQPVTQVKSKQQVFHARRLIISSFTLKSLCHSMSVTYDPQCSKQINHTD